MTAAAKYRKRPVAVTASQWFKNGDHPDDQVGHEEIDPTTGLRYTREEGAVVRFYWRFDVPGDSACDRCGFFMAIHGWIDTLEDGHRVCPGDWIITGVQGERYPCKPDIFAASYEPVNIGPGPLVSANIDTIARWIVAKAVAYATDFGTIGHEDLPDIGEDDYLSALARATAIAASINPDTVRYQEAYTALAFAAKKWEESSDA